MESKAHLVPVGCRPASPAVCARYENVYCWRVYGCVGRGELERRLVTATFRRAQRGEPAAPRGEGFAPKSDLYN